MPISIDLRSDTVTKPTPAMREAMLSAEVGDDVIGNDPTVELLQDYVAELLGKEAAVYMPSGTMTNQIAVRLHCNPGDEFLCEAGCHIYNYEQGGYAQLSGVVARTLEGQHGVLSPEQLHGQIHAENDHLLHTRMITLENTHNRGGGTVQPPETVEAICSWAKEHGLSTHLDGARLFNAVAASGVEAQRWAAGFDSVSVCFSKGLGAPIGSALAGSKEFIRRARRARKLFGGGMRQVGIIAAGALFAVQHHRERLVEDHRNAQLLATAVDRAEGLSLAAPPQTNIVIVQVAPQLGTSAGLVERLEEHGVGALPFGPQSVRLVTHLDVSRAQIESACEALEAVARELIGCS